MSLLGALRSAVSAMQVSQAAFQVTSTNIANVGTEGYSRKTVGQEPLVVDGRAAGVRLTDIERHVDLALQRQVRDQTMSVGALEVTESYLQRTQDLFGTLADNSSLAHTITELGAGWEALGTSTESIAARLEVIGAARQIVDQLNGTSAELQRMRLEADQEIERVVARVSAILTDVNSLNDQITLGKAQNRPVVELEDHRDRLLDELSKEIDVRILHRTTGEVVIYTTGGRALLDNTVTQLTHAAAAQVDAVISLGNGINGIGYGAAAIDITTEINGGRLAALIKVRDETMVDLQAEIDRLADTLTFQINALHNDGSPYPAPLTLTGERTLAATDRPSMTGSFRVAVIGATGLVVESLDINLATLVPPSIGQLVTTINAMANASASINAQGKVVIAATGSNGIAVNEMTSAVTTGNATYGEL